MNKPDDLFGDKMLFDEIFPVIDDSEIFEMAERIDGENADTVEDADEENFLF